MGTALLAFVLMNLQHVIFSVLLVLLFVSARQAFGTGKNSGGWVLTALSGTLLLFALAVSPVPWVIRQPFWFLLTLAALSAGGAFVARAYPAARRMFPAFAAASIASGFVFLALSGRAAPLLFAEALAFAAFFSWCIGIAASRADAEAGNERLAKENAGLRLKNEALGSVIAGLEEERDRLEKEKKAAEESVSRAVSDAVGKERARYVQDMHDGLGAELVSGLAAVKNGNLSQSELEEILQGCLDEMRIAIDASGVSREDFTSALANLRFRMGGRLKKAGIELRWNVLGMPDEYAMEPDRAQTALRALQEAFTNAVKYSRATELRVKAEVKEGVFSLTVRDNGIGSEASKEESRANGTGLGLSGMRRRAEASGGTLRFGAPEDGGKGFELSLTLPG